MKVVVIGGGPAGGAAAIMARQQGHETLMLERRAGVSRRPGETLHPGVAVVLGTLGLGEWIDEARFLRPSGILLETPEGERAIPYGSDESGAWQGYQALTARFDRALLERARELGAEVRREACVRDIMMSGNVVVGVVTDSCEIRADLVVDASGSSSLLRRRLGLAVERVSPQLIATWGHSGEQCASIWPRLRIDANGWLWKAPLGDGRLAWVQVSTSELRPQRATEQGRSRGADVTWRHCTKPAGPGYRLVGDAACVLDPASGKGVLRALMSGVMAVHSWNNPEGYTGWLGDWFRHEVIELAEFYSSDPMQCAWALELIRRRREHVNRNENSRIFTHASTSWMGTRSPAPRFGPRGGRNS